jgi:MoaA/NifB/PqqE/SkfB family radical SAM enzyme
VNNIATSPLVQIEITTKCNFECFYCAGRHMKQQNMSLELFENVLQSLGAAPLVVSLQGEGEPTAHPQFWAMVARLISLGHQPYTITNASLIDARVAALKFNKLGVSVDTLDEAEAHRIGRYKLGNVLRRLNELVACMGAARVIVHTVLYGQDIQALRAYVKELGCTHIVQPIQAKPDYSKHYGKAIPVIFWQYKKQCRYLERNLMRYFDVNGKEAPCCYIKDMGLFDTTEKLKSQLAKGQVPSACIGCREIILSSMKAASI